MADLTQWYYWQTFGSRVSNGGTNIVQTDYNADGSYASYTWSYRPNGALAYFTEISYGASGTLLTSNLWEYFPDGPLFQWSTDAYGYGQGWENDEAAGVILLTTFTPSGGANWFYSNGTLDTYRQLDRRERDRGVVPVRELRPRWVGPWFAGGCAAPGGCGFRTCSSSRIYATSSAISLGHSRSEGSLGSEYRSNVTTFRQPVR